MHLAPGLSVIFTHSSARMSFGCDLLSLINPTFVIHIPPCSCSRALEDIGEKREMLFPWNPGNGSPLEFWESRCSFQEMTVFLSSKWSESAPVDHCFPFNSAACALDLVWYCCFDGLSSFFFPPMLILNGSCQILMDRHLHSFTDVDVGKDYDMCGRMSVFAYDLYPYGYYHTHTHTDKWTHIPGKVLQVWKHGL